MTRIKSKYLALVAVLLTPVAANADLIEISGQGATDGTWDITLLTDSFNNNSALLMGQVWWANTTLAIAFADALGAVLGVDNFGAGLGPMFATSAGGTFIQFAAWSDGSIFPAGALSFTGNGSTILDQTFVYATAERVSVPEPGTLGLLGIGLAAIGLTRRRRKA